MTADAARAMVEVAHVRKQFGAHVVLEDVSLDVPKGAVLAIIGPSGSGKSTLLRCINLLTVPDAGFVRVGDKTIRFEPESRLPGDGELAAFRATTGMVFQHFNLFPHMSVLGNVMEGPTTVLRTPKHEARDLALALLEKVGLAEKANASPDRLSGGQKQRVAIARALAMRPTVLLFDEATSALDPELVGEVLSVIEGLAADGMTMLLVTHEMGFARDVANEILFMREGRVAERGPPAELIDHPQQPATASFLARFHRHTNGAPLP
ncbi:MAG: amino acid ABC transporter ATP-binding protein [Burkholderiaceae bacterium]|jgi:polar amino acid transport system ATP-binding protein